jgi:hypothetical protein
MYISQKGQLSELAECKIGLLHIFFVVRIKSNAIVQYNPQEHTQCDLKNCVSRSVCQYFLLCCDRKHVYADPDPDPTLKLA